MNNIDFFSLSKKYPTNIHKEILDVISFIYKYKTNIVDYNSIEEINITNFEETIDWCSLSCNTPYTKNFKKGCNTVRKNLSKDFIRFFKHKLDWNCITTYYPFSVKFAKEMENYIDWNRLATLSWKNLPQHFIKKYYSKFDIIDLVGCQTVSDDTLIFLYEKFKTNPNFHPAQLNPFWARLISKRKNDKNKKICTNLSNKIIVNKNTLSNKIILKYKNEIDWTFLLPNKNLSEKFLNYVIQCIINKEIKNINYREFLYYCFKYQNVSENFIRKYQKHKFWKTSWRFISQKQKLSEPFIEEFSNKINWTKLQLNPCIYQLSINFILKYQHKLNWYVINKILKHKLKNKNEMPIISVIPINPCKSL